MKHNQHKAGLFCVWGHRFSGGSGDEVSSARAHAFVCSCGEWSLTSDGGCVTPDVHAWVSAHAVSTLVFLILSLLFDRASLRLQCLGAELAQRLSKDAKAKGKAL